MNSQVVKTNPVSVAPRVALAIAVAVFLAPSTASANIGIPMLAVAWPIAWASLIPVVLIEGGLARRILKLQLGRAMKVSLVANLVSTFVGIPVIWALCVMPALVAAVTIRGSASARMNPLFWILYVPWLPPLTFIGNRSWVIPLCEAILCVPFFVGSAYTEFWVARKMLPGIENAELRRWSFAANGMSYIIIVAVLMFAVVVEAKLPGTFF